MRDLMTDEEFTKGDIITLQDPQNVEQRDLSTFDYIKRELKITDPSEGGTLSGINLAVSGVSKVLKSIADKVGISLAFPFFPCLDETMLTPLRVGQGSLCTFAAAGSRQAKGCASFGILLSLVVFGDSLQHLSRINQSDCCLLHIDRSHSSDDDRKQLME